jgi:hypothetical protein
MGHPPSDHALKCSVMLLVETSIKRLASGITGLEPLVRVFRMSDGSPVPILKQKYNYVYMQHMIIITIKRRLLGCDAT